MWFQQEILSSRFTSSNYWMVLLQYMLIGLVLLILECVSWHPFSGIKIWFFSMISQKVIFYNVVLLVVCLMFSYLHNFMSAADVIVCKTRYESIKKHLSWRPMLHSILMAIFGIICTQCYLGVFGDQGTGQHTSFLKAIFYVSPDYCYFILLHGMYMGILFSWRYIENEWNVLSFPLQQDSFSLSLRLKLPSLLHKSVSHVHGPFWFYPILLVSYGWICKWLYPYSTSRVNMWETLYSINYIKILLACFISSTLMHITWNLFIHVYNFHICKRHEFLIEPSLPEDKEKVLSRALVSTEPKIVQYLAFLDMRCVAQFSSSRRKQFFVISQPGGHPHQWNTLSSICLNLLSDLSSDLKKLTMTKPTPIFKPMDTKLDFHISQCQQKPGYFEMAKKYCRQLRISKYLLDELPNAEVLRIFNSCRLHIWIVEAFGFLVAASYTEDRYGAIQQSLPNILMSLIDIKLAEEKLPIGILYPTNHIKDPKMVQNGIALRQGLRSAIESALYRIVLTMKTDIRGVCVPSEYQRYLERYLEFKQ